MKIGLIGIIEDEMKQDLFGALSRVAQIGYRGMEFGLATVQNASLPPSELKRRMDDLGLTVVNYHLGGGTAALTSGYDQTAAIARATGTRYLTISWGPCDSAEQLKRDAEVYNRLGAQVKRDGFTLCYHNHDHELKSFGGEHGLDILMQHSDPENLKGQFDVCWLRFGGVDPAAFLRKYPGRIPLIHLKDVARLERGCETGEGDRERTLFTEVGTGIVDFEDVFAAAKEIGAEWGTVEQDRMRHLSPWESITCSYLNLKARGLA
jgi:sugar phosphate isomerase/epimerase